jgi:enoyl-CoA hydratase/carnithine racemase
MYSFLNSLIPGSATNTPPKVVIFDSADPEFFIAHLDKTIFMEPKTAEKNATFNMYLACTRLLWNITSTIFIGEVNGQGFDAANELLVQMDMRFTGPKTRVGATEIAFGITQGAGGLQFMNRLVNRGRAFEYILTGNNIDGPTAAAIGWANHYYDNARDLTNAVNALAHRIALFPASGINITKVGLNANNPSTAVLEQDKSNTEALISQPENGILEGKFYALSENQTRSPFELGLDDTLVDIFN